MPLPEVPCVCLFRHTGILKVLRIGVEPMVATLLTRTDTLPVKVLFTFYIYIITRIYTFFNFLLPSILEVLEFQKEKDLILLP